MRVINAAVRVSVALSLLGGCGATGQQDSYPASGDASAPDAATDAATDVAADVVQDEATAPEDAPAEVATADAAVGTGSLEKLSYAGPEGTRDYLLYVPAGADTTPLPLVVALHGCQESAAHFAYVSRFNLLADVKKFIVAWPEQTAVANSIMCWNWFLPAHQRRDTGEAAIIAAIARQVMASHTVDSKRVHAAGISAGGALALVEGTIFPDLFASVATVEGCPFRGAPCIGSLTTLSADALAQLAFDAMGTNARALPVFVVQGDLDMSVAPANGELIVQQFLGVADRADDGLSNGSVSKSPSGTTSGQVPGGHAFDTDVYAAGGINIVERWLVHGMGHAWPGGPPAIAYSDPAGPNITPESYRFFEEHPSP